MKRLTQWLLRAVVALLALVVLSVVAVGIWGYQRNELPLPVAVGKLEALATGRFPALAEPLGHILDVLGLRDLPLAAGTFPPVAQWQGIGAQPEASGVAPPLEFRRVEVNDPATLIAAIRAAQPGDVIQLAVGVYPLNVRGIDVSRGGTAERPIVVRAARLGDAQLRMNTLEGFVVGAPYWRFENLDIRGVCPDHGNCEHAFHIVGRGHHTVIRNSRLYDFNAMIKANGLEIDGRYYAPDAALIKGNSLYNTAVRNTGNPVTPIDVVGADDWVIRGNLIADFIKGRKDQTSYGAFVKGNARGTLLERNLVICEMHLAGHPGIRVGLSLGGGGTGASYCRDSDCSTEHRDGIIRNNLVLNCANDVGIYLNRAAGSKVYNNTLYRTVGIDARFAETDADIRNNVLTGRIKGRDGASVSEADNLIGSRREFEHWFMEPDAADFGLRDGDAIVGRGKPLPGVTDDLCGNPRNPSQPDLGAIEFGKLPCHPNQAPR